MSAVEASIIGVILIGLLHGLEPGHGWPLALLYSAKTTRPIFYAFVSSGILAAAHFISSIAVVIIYVVVSAFYDFSSIHHRDPLSHLSDHTQIVSDK